MKHKHSYDVYDTSETSEFIDKTKRLSLADLSLKLPSDPPTRVISVRIPTSLYNVIKAYSTQRDIPYQAYIKYLLAQGVEKNQKKVVNKMASLKKSK